MTIYSLHYTLNTHQLKAGGLTLCAESTDTGQQTRQLFFHFYTLIGAWLKMILNIENYMTPITILRRPAYSWTYANI